MSRRMAVGAMGIVVGLIIAGCSGTDALVERPAEYDSLATDEVGCVFRYGDDAPSNTGLIEQDRWVDMEPNEWTKLSVRRTGSDMIVAVYEDDRSGADVTLSIDELPNDGVLLQGAFVDQGHPGYVIACWRGEN